MDLVPALNSDGEPVFWFNPAHVVSIRPLMLDDGRSITLRADLKLAGSVVERVHIGVFGNRGAADTAWQAFMASIQGPRA